MMLLLCAALITAWPDAPQLKDQQTLVKEAEEKERALQVRLHELLQKAQCNTRLTGRCLEISSGKRESWIEQANPKRICVGLRKTWILLQPTDSTSGLAWIIQELSGIYDPDQRKSIDQWQAWKGDYSLSIDR